MPTPLCSILLLFILQTRGHRIKNIHTCSRGANDITAGFIHGIPEENEQLYLKISVNTDKSSTEIQMKKGDRENVVYYTETNLVSSDYTFSILFETTVDGIIKFSNVINKTSILYLSNKHPLSIEIEAASLGQTELIIRQVLNNQELKNVKYYVKHSLASVSVYYSDVWRTLALVLGYTFAICSFFGFVPQVIYNQWRKSVAGLDLAFLILEVIDAIIYLVYAIGLFYLDAITEQYTDTHETQVIPVAWYDIMFSIQTMAVFLMLLVQYGYFRDGNKGMNL